MDNEAQTEETTKTEETVDTKPSTENTDQTETAIDDQTVDSDKVVDKLKHRIGKEQAEKNSALDQVKELKAKLADYESGKVNVKKLSDDDKKKQEQAAKDTELQNLRDKVKIMEASQQTDEVFKEAGLSVNKDVLAMVVSAKDETTLDNAKALIDFANEIKEATRQEYMKGSTPKVNGKPVDTNVTQEQFDLMTMAEKVNLQAKNPELFKKLTGGI
ncbi:MAG: DUF4355 domain-containing protein [Lactobacillus sp.]|nr:MAG: DUF4355 domain-containing protein [Lactobacillus sp.]